MPENKPPTGNDAPGGASGSVGGGGGEGKAVLGGAGGQTRRPRALFVGHIFPAPLDKDGRLIDQSLKKGLGPPHLISVIYAYDEETKSGDGNVHAHIDEILGRPAFKAYLYPITDHNSDKVLMVGGGGGEGKAVLGGASGDPIYLGQFHATVPDTSDSGSTPGTGGGTPPAPGGGGGGGAPTR
jgi:hypothetical protein